MCCIDLDEGIIVSSFEPKSTPTGVEPQQDPATKAQLRGRNWPRHLASLSLSWGLAGLMSGCSLLPGGNAPTASSPGNSSGGVSAAAPQGGTAPASGDAAARSKTPTAPGAKPRRLVVLDPPKPVRNGDELRKQAAQRLVAANPDQVYLGQVPDILLAIPVLEVELRRDGTVRNVHVLRRPGQALETLQMAIDAVHRAAPFGDVSRMPQPWKFTETFLFNDDRRFKPRTLD